jgi:hypothetical protein
MADAMTLYRHKSFHMIVIIYEQIYIGKQIKEIIEINLTESHELLFGDLSLSELSELDSLIKKVPQKRSPTNEEHEAMYALRDTLQQKCYLQLNIKCNSQQSRLQCSFNKFQDFIKKCPDRILYHSFNNTYHDVNLTEVLNIKPRTFL